jgi:MFS superfamily sulfate permease-like transporter
MGIAVTVMVAQLPKLFGFSVDAENLIPAVRDFIAGLDETNATALAIGVGSLALILGLRRVAPAIPGVFLAVVAATALVAALGLAGTHTLTRHARPSLVMMGSGRVRGDGRGSSLRTSPPPTPRVYMSAGTERP